ncbi:hypothetical protein JOB18_016576 [Solea senegalensis]|uniref:Uncharacterized protein n=1 Tax=Solea senegalensis TaxID=28829 RepID=A0AAV6PVL0_SOLSE|nr:hypothetical protein JOB18_016576 [Solea senegalensis]
MASSVACFKDKFTLARQHRLHIYTERKSETERERESETGGRNRQSCCERINLSVKHEKRSLCNFTALVRRSTAVQFPRYFHIIFASFPSRTQAGNHRSRNDGVITDGNTAFPSCEWGLHGFSIQWRHVPADVLLQSQRQLLSTLRSRG